MQRQTMQKNKKKSDTVDTIKNFKVKVGKQTGYKHKCLLKTMAANM